MNKVDRVKHALILQTLGEFNSEIKLSENNLKPFKVPIFLPDLTYGTKKAVHTHTHILLQIYVNSYLCVC